LTLKEAADLTEAILMRIKTFPYRGPSLLLPLLAVTFALCIGSRADAGIADAVKYVKLDNGLQLLVL